MSSSNTAASGNITGVFHHHKPPTSREQNLNFHRIWVKGLLNEVALVTTTTAVIDNFSGNNFYLDFKNLIDFAWVIVERIEPAPYFQSIKMLYFRKWNRYKCLLLPWKLKLALYAIQTLRNYDGAMHLCISLGYHQIPRSRFCLTRWTQVKMVIFPDL